AVAGSAAGLPWGWRCGPGRQELVPANGMAVDLIFGEEPHEAHDLVERRLPAISGVEDRPGVIPALAEADPVSRRRHAATSAHFDTPTAMSAQLAETSAAASGGQTELPTMRPCCSPVI